MVDDFVGDDVKMETHVLGIQHGGVEIEIGKINTQKLGPRGTDGGTMSSLAVVRSAIGVLLFPG
jgi:hypothetical protein